MRYLGVAFCIFALVLVSQARIIAESVPQLSAVIAAVVVELTNDERASAGLGTLTVSEALTQAAERKARDMAEKGYFAHTSPEGVTPWHWFQEVGYTFVYAGENLAVDFDESPEVVRAWMHSPTHRANIVGTQFTEIGVAVEEGTYQNRPAVFVVQMFGTPRQAPGAVVTSVDNSTREVALATTLPGEPPTEVEVLGESAGAVLETPIAVPWWYRVILEFSNLF